MRERDFIPAKLTDEQLIALSRLETQLSQQTDDNIVLIAYRRNTTTGFVPDRTTQDGTGQDLTTQTQARAADR